MAEKTSIQLSELLKNCYGTERQQKEGSCWFDSTLEIMLNADLIGEIVRANVFDYGLHKDKVVPYRVKSEIINKDGRLNIECFILYIILNYILFNMEITNNIDFIVFQGDKYEIKRKDELDMCEQNLEIFLAKTKRILKDILQPNKKIKKASLEKFYSSDKLTDDDYGGFQYCIYQLFFNNISVLNEFINIKIYNGTSKFPEAKDLFKKSVFLAASLSFSEHATSVIRCQDIIFYYDNNAPIDILTKKRNIDFGKQNIDGYLKSTPEFLENFWTNGLNYLKHWGAYFKKENRKRQKFEYINNLRSTNINEFYKDVTIFERKEETTKYDKKIPLIKLDDSINLKDILACEFFKNKSIIINSISSKRTETKSFVNECYRIFVSQMHISNKYLSKEINEESQFYQKYKKYKVKYLNLLAKINSKKN
jgi:hypothetical protein